LYAPSGDAQDLSNAVLQALEPDVRRLLREHAAEQAKQHGWAPVIHAWSSLLARVIEGSRQAV
jgi:hypothetical protein